MTTTRILRAALALVGSVALTCAISTSEALGLIWKDVVIEDPPGASPRLSDPAVSILERPTFLQDYTASPAPVEAPRTAPRLLQGAGWLPRFAKVLPYVGGAVTAFEVCDVLTDGCFLFKQDQGPPDINSAPGIWQANLRRHYDISAPAGPALRIPAFSYYRAPSNGGGGVASYVWRVDGCGTTVPPVPETTQVPLHWGTKRWGWRKVRISHSYSGADAVQTAEALQTDPVPTPDPHYPTDHWNYHLFYQMPRTGGGTVGCKRTVAVEFYVDKNARAAGLERIRGVRNSYTGLAQAP